MWASRLAGNAVAGVLLEKFAGAGISIGEANLMWSKAAIELNDVVVRNPEGLPDGSSIEIERLLAKVRWPSLLTATPHFRDLEVSIREITIGAGPMTVNSEREEPAVFRYPSSRTGDPGLSSQGEQPPEPDREYPPATAGLTRDFPLPRIDRLYLQVGTLRWQTSPESEIAGASQTLNLEVTATDVDEFEDIENAVMEQGLTSVLAAFGSQAEVDASDVDTMERLEREGLADLDELLGGAGGESAP